jgi:inosose dehydratase
MHAHADPVCSRRKFLGASAAGAARAAGAAGAATLGFAGLAQAGENKPRDPFGGFIVGVQSYSFRNFNLEQCLTRTRDLGLHFIEFFRGHVPLESTDTQIKAARNLCFQYNVTPIAFGVEPFTKDHAANRRRFEFARKLGVRYLSADPTPDSFDSLDRLVQEFGIGIAIHPHGPVGKQLHRWYSAEIILNAVRNHHRLIGTCLDTGHLIRSAQDPFNRKLDPAQQVRHMGQRNFGLHLKDHDNAKRTDVVYGRGVLNVPEVLRALREVKFQGYISIEYEANPDNPSPDMRACIEVFREAVQKLG